MEAILNKITSYGILNYILAGGAFHMLSDNLKISIIQFPNEIVTLLLAYYFVGLIISRIGSLIIEPIFKYAKIIQMCPYEDFVKASKADHNIEIFSEHNHIYRTLLSVILVLIICISLAYLPLKSICVFPWFKISVLILLAVLLSFSYRKQTSYITKRINIALNGENK